MDKPLKNRH